MHDAIVGALAEALSESGVRARGSFPLSRMDLKDGAVVCVSVRSSVMLSSGMGDYLGRAVDSQGNDCGELYGLKLELSVGLDIYAPAGRERGAGECLLCYERVSRALTELPSGLKMRELRCGEAQPDGITEGYKCPVELLCTAHIVGQTDGDSGGFLDFILKGVVKND